MSTRSASAPSSSLRSKRGHKERSKNFTELEKRIVLEQIGRHRDVLRQGRSNNATNRSKQMDDASAPGGVLYHYLVWSSICEEVNKRCGGDRPRTPAQVKMWYENYKKKCKMRAHEPQQQTDTPNLLDGMLWQNIHPLEVKDDDGDASGSADGNHSVKDDDLPINMSNGRNSTCNDPDDSPPNVLEPHVQILPRSPASPAPRTPRTPVPPPHPLHLLTNPLQLFEQAQQSYLHTLSHLTHAPLNLSHLEGAPEHGPRPADAHDPRPPAAGPDEERLYFMTKRQHAASEHEARMKILNMELRQKEELFSLQKQLFLIEMKLKMDFLEKASGK